MGLHSCVLPSFSHFILFCSLLYMEIINRVGSGAVLLPRQLLLAYQGGFKKERPDLIATLVKRIKTDGFISPIFIWQNAPGGKPQILDGHQRLKALDALEGEGYTLADDKVPTVGILASNDKEAWESIFSYNRTFSEIDADIAIQISQDLEIDLGEHLPERFIVPPFSILDTRQGYWLDRKRHWKTLIVDDGESREETLFKEGNTEMAQKISEIGTVSIFDPVLAEVLAKWFCPTGGKIFDTFAGGASGFVYSYLGHPFTGIELRPEQVKINNDRLTRNSLAENSRYVCDDGQNILDHVEENSQDFFFSCPPYFDLEQYSDDPRDASNQEYGDFLKILDTAFTGAAKALKNNRFAAIVMSNVRDKNGFYHDICGEIRTIMARNGLKLYNEIVLINSFGSGMLRAGHNMRNRKVVRTHQDVIVFYKADDKEDEIAIADDFSVCRQVVGVKEDILVFYKGDVKEIQKAFPPEKKKGKVSKPDEDDDDLDE